MNELENMDNSKKLEYAKTLLIHYFQQLHPYPLPGEAIEQIGFILQAVHDATVESYETHFKTIHARIATLESYAETSHTPIKPYSKSDNEN